MNPVKTIRCAVADLTYIICNTETKTMINEDVDRYLKWNKGLKNKRRISRLNYCLIFQREFRNVFYYRINSHSFLVAFSRLFLRKAEAVEIGGTIGGGLYISHRYAVVFPERAGKNFRVGPGVVIGKNRDKSPVIGNNVYIASNSTVIGGITIGDNTIIGAGSVVTKSLSGNGIYAGNPVRFIKHIEDDERYIQEIQ